MWKTAACLQVRDYDLHELCPGREVVVRSRRKVVMSKLFTASVAGTIISAKSEISFHVSGRDFNLDYVQKER